MRLLQAFKKLENFKNQTLKSKLKSNYIQFDTITNKWTIHKYEIREFIDNGEIITKGEQIDTIINLTPYDFTKKRSLVETMNMFELNNYISEEKIKGSEQIIFHKIEKHKRIAFPFAAIILTLIAVAISSRKVNGGVGIHLGIGILIAFSYILFMQISTTFSTHSNLNFHFLFEKCECFANFPQKSLRAARWGTSCASSTSRGTGRGRPCRSARRERWEGKRAAEA